MAEVWLINIAVWLTALGLLIFVILYLWLAQPWRDRMSRHILYFMGGLALAFTYYIIASNFVTESNRLWWMRGWILVLFIVAIMVWWRVGIFLAFQIRDRNGIRK